MSNQPNRSWRKIFSIWSLKLPPMSRSAIAKSTSPKPNAKSTFEKANKSSSMTSNLISLSLVSLFSITGENQTEDDSEGSYKVKEILSDDLNDMIIDDVKSNEKNKTGDLMIKWIKKNAKDKIVGVSNRCKHSLCKMSPIPKNLKKTKRKERRIYLPPKRPVKRREMKKKQRAKEKKLKEEAMQKNFE